MPSFVMAHGRDAVADSRNETTRLAETSRAVVVFCADSAVDVWRRPLLTSDPFSSQYRRLPVPPGCLSGLRRNPVLKRRFFDGIGILPSKP